MDKFKKIEEQKKQWEEKTLNKVLERFPEQKETFTTGSWLPVERLYLPRPFSEEEYLENVGFPGQYPLREVCNLPCIGDAFGPCASTPVLVRQKNRIGVTNTYWNKDKPV